jgi:hypothetical protein
MKQLRLTIEIVPKPLRGVSLYKTMLRSAWKKLREQVKVQHNNRCGICQVGNVTRCHPELCVKGESKQVNRDPRQRRSVHLI